MKKKLIALFIVLAVVGGGAFLLKNRQAQQGHGQAPALLPVVVETHRVEPGHTRLTLPVVADVQALHDSLVASRLTAYVTALPLYEGQTFHKGAVLARLDVSQAEADAQRAEAVLAQSRLQEATLAADLAAAESVLKSEQERVQRLQALYQIQGVSLEQVQAAEAALATVRARQTGAAGAMQSYTSLNQANRAAAAAAKQNLRYAVMTAPFDGVVSQRLAQPGDLATPGKPLLKIIDTNAGNRLLVDVPETIQPAGLVVDGELLPLTAWPEASPQGLRRYEARGGEFLTPGSRIDARLVVFRSPTGLRLPAECLMNDDGKSATVLALAGKTGAAPAAGHGMKAGEGHPPQHGQAAAHSTPAGHHPQPSAGKLEALQIVLAARGEEGAASADERLIGRDLVCASPDILARLAAGAPFQIRERGNR
jgi:pyruvate/2-oxoglutarate dehydrogenase complex dihydrolipoamide acyltransferase (E2) component